MFVIQMKNALRGLSAPAAWQTPDFSVKIVTIIFEFSYFTNIAFFRLIYKLIVQQNGDMQELQQESAFIHLSL